MFEAIFEGFLNVVKVCAMQFLSWILGQG